VVENRKDLDSSGGAANGYAGSLIIVVCFGTCSSWSGSDSECLSFRPRGLVLAFG